MTVIGIDFGTSFIKVGLFNDFGLQILVNENRKICTPSVALLFKGNKWFFGEQAIKYSAEKSNQYVYDTKIMLGRKFEDPIIQNMKGRFPFGIKNADNKIKISISIDDKPHEFFPYEVTGAILKNLLKVTKLADHITNSLQVISIPALFNKNQKEDLKKACECAKLSNFIFKSEPILASIAYLNNMQININQPQNIIVFNLGTYYLDISIIKIHDKTYEITTVHDEEINSRKIDDNIYNYILSKMNKKYPKKSSYFNRPNIQSILHQKCEEAKTTLSELSEAYITIDDLHFKLTLDEFNQLNSELFERIIEKVQDSMKKGNVRPKDLNHLFLVGGCTFVKEIEKILEKILKLKPCTFVDRREAVAIGACIAGKAMIDQENDDKMTVVDILIKEPLNRQSNESESTKNSPLKNQNEKNKKIDLIKPKKLSIESNYCVNIPLNAENDQILYQKDQLNKILIFLSKIVNETFEKELTRELLPILKNQYFEPSIKIETFFQKIKDYYENKILYTGSECAVLKSKMAEMNKDVNDFVNDISNALFNETFGFIDVTSAGTRQNFIQKCKRIKEKIQKSDRIIKENNDTIQCLKHKINNISNIDQKNEMQYLKEQNMRSMLKKKDNEIAKINDKYQKLENEKKEIISFVFDNFNDIEDSHMYIFMCINPVQSFKDYIAKVKSKIMNIKNEDKQIRSLVGAFSYQKTSEAVKSFISSKYISS